MRSQFTCRNLYCPHQATSLLLQALVSKSLVFIIFFLRIFIFNTFPASFRQNQCFSPSPTLAAWRISGCRAFMSPMREWFLQNLGCFQEEEVTTEGTAGKTKLCCARRGQSCCVVGLQCQIMLTASPAHLNTRLFFRLLCCPFHCLSSSPFSSCSAKGNGGVRWEKQGCWQLLFTQSSQMYWRYFSLCTFLPEASSNKSSI